ncbi:MAG TPA: FAD-dependent oxidoreductase [Roseiflexaceae bacterium]|nr:FAD-dependent oxidoreductase [Roseiflexaceae bacterium]
MHGIWSPYRNLRAALARCDVPLALRPSREEGWIYGRGSLVRRAAVGSAIRRSPLPAPFHYLYLFTRPRFLNILTPADLLALPRVLAGLLVAMSVDPLAEQRTLRGASLADLTEGWTPTLRNFFAALARSGLAAHPDEVPAAGFIAFLRFYTLLRRDSWAFDYLPGTGAALIAEPLAEVVRARGCEIRMGARALRLERAGQRWRVLYAGAGGQEGVAEAGRVVLALDAPAAAELLRASPATAPAASGMRFPQGVPTAIFRLWFEGQPRPGPDSGIIGGDFVMDNFFWLHRLQPEYAAWSAATGGSAVEMHIYGPPEVLARPDAALLALVVTDAARAFPELRGALLHAVVQHNEPAHTLFAVGEPGEHLGVETPWPEVFACGDWVYHPAPALFLERAATTAIAAANGVLASLGREPWPLLAHPQPEWLAARVAAGMRRVRRAVWATKTRKHEDTKQR